jgi:hypothetical protein
MEVLKKMESLTETESPLTQVGEYANEEPVEDLNESTRTGRSATLLSGEEIEPFPRSVDS